MDGDDRAPVSRTHDEREMLGHVDAVLMSKKLLSKQFLWDFGGLGRQNPKPVLLNMAQCSVQTCVNLP